MAVSKRLRYEVLRRDNYACRYCGQVAPDVRLTVDHVIPVALGGQDTAANLVAACTACNAGKAASNPDAPLVADVTQAALKWQLAIKLAADLTARDRERLDLDVGSVLTAWFTTFEHVDEQQRPYPEPDAETSIRTWLASGLTTRDLFEFIAVTEAKWYRDGHLRSDRTWRYFAGCCWNRLSELQERARGLIDSGEV